MITNILSIEQVLVFRMLLYSPPQAGYGTSCDESCLGGYGILKISSILALGKSTQLKQVLGSRNLFFWLDGLQGDWISGTPCTNC